MTRLPPPAQDGRQGWIVILNGAPRAGKSSIAAALQDGAATPWMNLGVDAYARVVTPERFQPGIGLRPGGERPDLEAWLPLFYAALYESVAAHSRLGLDVVVDIGHHDGHSRPLHILPACARRLDGLPALLVGVRCPIEVIMARRNAEQNPIYETRTPGEPLPLPVRRWQDVVHRPGIYDLEVDTGATTAWESAARIRRRLAEGRETFTALKRLAASGDG